MVSQRGGRKKRLTIYDVARITGFSRGSISRAFNDSPFINAETKQRILEAAKEIGYQPHPGARLIKASRTRRWGILLPGFLNPYYASLYEALDREARRLDTFLQLGLFHYDPEVTETLATYWSAGEVDGLLVDTGAGFVPAIERARQAGVPILYLHSRPTPQYDVLVQERKIGTSQVLAHFKRLGHRSVAYVGMNHEHNRETGPYLAWSESLSPGTAERMSCFVPNSSDGGEQGWRELRARGVQFTAILAYNDIIACGLLSAARAEGLRVPEDLSVVGHDDIDEARRLGLNTIRNDFQQLARVAFAQLEARRIGDQGPPSELFVLSEYVERSTVGPSPKSAPAKRVPSRVATSKRKARG